MTIPNNTPDCPTKQCAKCGNVYPATTEYWHRDKKTKDGFKSACKPCRVRSTQDYYASHRDERLEYARQYNQDNREMVLNKKRIWRENNPDAYKEWYKKNRAHRQNYMRQWEQENRDYRIEYHKRYNQENPHRQRTWRSKNRDKILKQRRALYQNNPARYRKQKRQWRQNNPEKARAIINRRRARKNNAAGSHTSQELQDQYNRQRGKCYYCGCALENDWHADHVIPLARGGSNYISNIVCACPSCNTSKQDKLLHEWDGSERLI